MRYDRNEVSAINANLAAGTVTDQWNGSKFTHSISNVEEISGSRNGNDVMSPVTRAASCVPMRAMIHCMAAPAQTSFLATVVVIT